MWVLKQRSRRDIYDELQRGGVRLQGRWRYCQVGVQLSLDDCTYCASIGVGKAYGILQKPASAAARKRYDSCIAGMNCDLKSRVCVWAMQQRSFLSELTLILQWEIFSAWLLHGHFGTLSCHCSDFNTIRLSSVFLYFELGGVEQIDATRKI